MANGNQKQVNGTEQQGQVQQTSAPVQQEAPVVVQPTVVVEQQKEGFGAWLKRHWKGVVAGVLGTGGVVTSAVVAYKKGKAAGMQAVPPVEVDDYSLNPNN